MHVIRRLPSDHVLLALVLGTIALVLFTVLALHAVVGAGPGLGSSAGAPAVAHLVDAQR